MPAKPTTLYPIKNRWLHEAPAAVHEVPTKTEADELIATGAFTDDPRHPDRDLEAPDLTAPPEPPAETPAADQPIGAVTATDEPAAPAAAEASEPPSA
jgi:hypothetical protein